MMSDARNHARYNIITLLCLLVLFATTTPLSYATHAEAMVREIDPVVVSGNKLSGLMGRTIDNIRVFSFRGAKAAMIPFQIDQKDSSGNWMWDSSMSAVAKERDDAAKKARLNANDELVFMLFDAGDKTTDSHGAIAAERVVEIEIIDPVNHTSHWAYAAYYKSDPPPLVSTRYMRYRAKDQTVISPVYEFSYSIENIAVMNNLILNGRSIMDRTKVRGRLDWNVLFFNGTVEFNEDAIEGYMEGYIDGPVRTVTRTVDHLRLDSGINTPEVNSDHLYYKHHSEIPLLLSKVYPVNQVSMLATTDYRNEPFDAVYIDGVDTPIEIKTTPSDDNLLADYNDATWMALDGRYGSILSVVIQPETLNAYLSVSPYLFQDKNTSKPPETYRGSSPEAGYRFRILPGAPGGDYVLTIAYLLSTSPFQRGDERKLLAMINNPLVVKATLIADKGGFNNQNL